MNLNGEIHILLQTLTLTIAEERRGEIELTYKILHLHATELAHVLVIVRGLVAVGPRRHGRGAALLECEKKKRSSGEQRVEEQSE